MKKAKMRKFAAWLREQPNKIKVPGIPEVPGVCGMVPGYPAIKGYSVPAFNWLDSYKCVATYVDRWAYRGGKDTGHSVASHVFHAVFNVSYPAASQLYKMGGLEPTKRACKKVVKAKLSKVADVIELVADGYKVPEAMFEVFGRKSFKK